ncbi:hypothetical protein G3480_20965 [Thiorhodococcus mannitoliphagus]|uniref:Uncharacterized protein n=1 Tax=Thiorhodococcus mannitoliphagus TaxID=329406 RepID=A0A6P1E403_9GAMM|nr:hypothetical protein [Thiorhodococcus mannitoliphagus]NEX22744.1 hypothetical protein [Thiorhodococcus mannitoliphagus]
MPDFSVALALYDFAPVVLTGLAVWLLASLARVIERAHYPMMLLGGVLVVSGGLAKALWKLIAALTGQDIGWLAALLFPLMAPGFTLIAVAAWGILDRVRGQLPRLGWLAASVTLLVLIAAVGVREWVLSIPRGWFMPLLVFTSLGNLVASVQLIRASLHLRSRVAASLFGLNLLFVFALPPIAIAAPATLWMHWVEQTLTTAGAGCFAAAAYLLWRLVQQPWPPVSG